MSPQAQHLTDAVAAVKGQGASIITLLGGFAQFVRDNVDDPAALGAMADELDAQAQAFVDAINANPLPGAKPV